jgi:hypothetical protein
MLNIWLRNTFLNMLILALALSSVLLSPHWLASIADTLDETRPAAILRALTFGWLGSASAVSRNTEGLTDYWWVLMIVAALFIGLNLASFYPPDQLKRRWMPAWLFKERAVVLFIVAPIFLAAWGAGTTTPKDLLNQTRISRAAKPVLTRIADLYQLKASISDRTQRATIDRELADLRGKLDAAGTYIGAETVIQRASVEFALVTALLVLVVSVAGRLDLTYYPARHTRLWRVKAIWAYIRIMGVCLIAVVPSGMLDYFWLTTTTKPVFFDNPSKLDSQKIMEILTVSAPAFLTLLSIAVFLYMGLLGRHFPDDRREWMARLSGLLALCCIGWVAVCGTATYGPGFVDWLGSKTAGYLGKGGISVAWILTTVAGAFSGRAAAKDGGASVAGIPASLVAKVAPPLFVGGLLLLLSKALSSFAPQQGWGAFGMSAGCGLLALFLSSRVDINEFSLHLFYRNRLVRCYLGGARAGREPGRMPDPFTGFDSRDDFPVSALAPSKGYSGPYPIFNTTLNLAHGDELAWQERKGEAFVFTPKFSGFDVTHGRATHPRKAGQPKLSYGGYRPTHDYAYPGSDGISVGTAVAISGAAGSPNQGRQTSASTAFLMTVLDVRLGWWLGNPRRTDTWKKPGPTTGLFQLLAELTARTNDTGKYVNLSDGGFFENLAAYELIRRRCRYIVACDSEEDHDYTFGGLGSLIRKCRTDFGVEIEIDVSQLKPAKDARSSGAHCAVGKIHYPGDLRGPAAEGILIYIKSSLTGDESADVQQFSLMNPRFPHESTANQWFDETRFESYRKLGYHAAESLTTGGVAETARALFGDTGQPDTIPPIPRIAAAAAG